jgi:hypothetical protein
MRFCIGIMPFTKHDTVYTKRETKILIISALRIYTVTPDADEWCTL